MPSTGPSHAVASDLTRVTEALEMLRPRWSVWTLMTLSDQPARFTELKARLPHLADSQISGRLRRLTEDGLVHRIAASAAHVSYRLTDRGADLTPVLAALATWGDTRLEKQRVPSKAIPGMFEPERIPAAQNAEDTLALLTYRLAVPVMWRLQVLGTVTAVDLAGQMLGEVTPGRLYRVMSQLLDDGIAERAGSTGYRLTDHGRSLAPVFRLLSTWAAGRRASATSAHPVWSLDQDRPEAGRDRGAGGQRRTQSTAAPGPALTTAPGRPTWRPGDLFSHGTPVPLAGAAAMGGRAR